MSVDKDLNAARLKLLTLSQHKLQMAKKQKWAELESYEFQWQTVLAEAFELYGDELEGILPQLNKDNEILIELVSTAQKKTNSEYQLFKKSHNQLKQYLK